VVTCEIKSFQNNFTSDVTTA